ncbi:MAG: MerC domain-containing protein [Pseudomonadota bacterium]
MIAVLQRQFWFDGLATGASLLCLVHCLLLPFVIVLIPSLTTVLTLPEEAHIWALAFAVPTSGIALWLGYFRHRRTWPVMAVMAGLLFLVSGVVAPSTERAETLLTVIGALTLSIGHAMNWRASRHANALVHNDMEK